MYKNQSPIKIKMSYYSPLSIDNDDNGFSHMGYLRLRPWDDDDLTTFCGNHTSMTSRIEEKKSI